MYTLKRQMIPYTLGAFQKDRIKNGYIRVNVGVTDRKKMREKWIL